MAIHDVCPVTTADLENLIKGLVPQFGPHAEDAAHIAFFRNGNQVPHNAEAALALLRPENAPAAQPPATGKTAINILDIVKATPGFAPYEHMHDGKVDRPSHMFTMPSQAAKLLHAMVEAHTDETKSLETRINQALHLLSSEQTQNGFDRAMFTTAVKDYQEKAAKIVESLSEPIEKETNDERMASATAIASPVDREIDEALMNRGQGDTDHEALVERQEASLRFGVVMGSVLPSADGKVGPMIGQMVSHGIDKNAAETHMFSKYGTFEAIGDNEAVTKYLTDAEALKDPVYGPFRRMLRASTTLGADGKYDAGPIQKFFSLYSGGYGISPTVVMSLSGKGEVSLNRRHARASTGPERIPELAANYQSKPDNVKNLHDLLFGPRAKTEDGKALAFLNENAETSKPGATTYHTDQVKNVLKGKKNIGAYSRVTLDRRAFSPESQTQLATAAEKTAKLSATPEGAQATGYTPEQARAVPGRLQQRYRTNLADILEAIIGPNPAMRARILDTSEYGPTGDAAQRMGYLAGDVSFLLPKLGKLVKEQMAKPSADYPSKVEALLRTELLGKMAGRELGASERSNTVQVLGSGVGDRDAYRKEGGGGGDATGASMKTAGYPFGAETLISENILGHIDAKFGTDLTKKFRLAGRYPESGVPVVVTSGGLREVSTGYAMAGASLPPAVLHGALGKFYDNPTQGYHPDYATFVLPLEGKNTAALVNFPRELIPASERGSYDKASTWFDSYLRSLAPGVKDKHLAIALGSNGRGPLRGVKGGVPDKMKYIVIHGVVSKDGTVSDQDIKDTLDGSMITHWFTQDQRRTSFGGEDVNKTHVFAVLENIKQSFLVKACSQVHEGVAPGSPVPAFADAIFKAHGNEGRILHGPKAGPMNDKAFAEAINSGKGVDAKQYPWFGEVKDVDIGGIVYRTYSVNVDSASERVAASVDGEGERHNIDVPSPVVTDTAATMPKATLAARAVSLLGVAMHDATRKLPWMADRIQDVPKRLHRTPDPQGIAQAYADRGYDPAKDPLLADKIGLSRASEADKTGKISSEGGYHVLRTAGENLGGLVDPFLTAWGKMVDGVRQSPLIRANDVSPNTRHGHWLRADVKVEDFEKALFDHVSSLRSKNYEEADKNKARLMGMLVNTMGESPKDMRMSFDDLFDKNMRFDKTAWYKPEVDFSHESFAHLKDKTGKSMVQADRYLGGTVVQMSRTPGGMTSHERARIGEPHRWVLKTGKWIGHTDGKRDGKATEGTRWQSHNTNEFSEHPIITKIAGEDKDGDKRHLLMYALDEHGAILRIPQELEKYADDPLELEPRLTKIALAKLNGDFLENRDLYGTETEMSEVQREARQRATDQTTLEAKKQGTNGLLEERSHFFDEHGGEATPIDVDMFKDQMVPYVRQTEDGKYEETMIPKTQWVDIMNPTTEGLAGRIVRDTNRQNASVSKSMSVAGKRVLQVMRAFKATYTLGAAEPLIKGGKKNPLPEGVLFGADLKPIFGKLTRGLEDAKDGYTSWSVSDKFIDNAVNMIIDTMKLEKPEAHAMFLTKEWSGLLTTLLGTQKFKDLQGVLDFHKDFMRWAQGPFGRAYASALKEQETPPSQRPGAEWLDPAFVAKAPGDAKVKDAKVKEAKFRRDATVYRRIERNMVDAWEALDRRVDRFDKGPGQRAKEHARRFAELSLTSRGLSNLDKVSNAYRGGNVDLESGASLRRALSGCSERIEIHEPILLKAAVVEARKRLSQLDDAYKHSFLGTGEYSIAGNLLISLSDALARARGRESWMPTDSQYASAKEYANASAHALAAYAGLSAHLRQYIGNDHAKALKLTEDAHAAFFAKDPSNLLVNGIQGVDKVKGKLKYLTGLNQTPALGYETQKRYYAAAEKLGSVTVDGLTITGEDFQRLLFGYSASLMGAQDAPLKGGFIRLLHPDVRAEVAQRVRNLGYGGAGGDPSVARGFTDAIASRAEKAQVPYTIKNNGDVVSRYDVPMTSIDQFNEPTIEEPNAADIKKALSIKFEKPEVTGEQKPEFSPLRTGIDFDSLKEGSTDGKGPGIEAAGIFHDLHNDPKNPIPMSDRAETQEQVYWSLVKSSAVHSGNSDAERAAHDKLVGENNRARGVDIVNGIGRELGMTRFDEALNRIPGIFDYIEAHYDYSPKMIEDQRALVDRWVEMINTKLPPTDEDLSEDVPAHVISAAIRDGDKNETGDNHVEIAKRMSPDISDEDIAAERAGPNAGFLVQDANGEKHFADRKEAFTIAREAGQLKPEFAADEKQELHSPMFDRVSFATGKEEEDAYGTSSKDWLDEAKRGLPSGKLYRGTTRNTLSIAANGDLRLVAKPDDMFGRRMGEEAGVSVTGDSLHAREYAAHRWNMLAEQRGIAEETGDAVTATRFEEETDSLAPVVVAIDPEAWAKATRGRVVRAGQEARTEGTQGELRAEVPTGEVVVIPKGDYSIHQYQYVGGEHGDTGYMPLAQNFQADSTSTIQETPAPIQRAVENDPEIVHEMAGVKAKRFVTADGPSGSVKGPLRTFQAKHQAGDVDAVKQVNDARQTALDHEVKGRANMSTSGSIGANPPAELTALHNPVNHPLEKVDPTLADDVSNWVGGKPSDAQTYQYLSEHVRISDMVAERLALMGQNAAQNQLLAWGAAADRQRTRADRFNTNVRRVFAFGDDGRVLQMTDIPVPTLGVGEDEGKRIGPDHMVRGFAFQTSAKNMFTKTPITEDGRRMLNWLNNAMYEHGKVNDVNAPMLTAIKIRNPEKLSDTVVAEIRKMLPKNLADQVLSEIHTNPDLLTHSLVTDETVLTLPVKMVYEAFKGHDAYKTLIDAGRTPEMLDPVETVKRGHEYFEQSLKDWEDTVPFMMRSSDGTFLQARDKYMPMWHGTGHYAHAVDHIERELNDALSKRLDATAENREELLGKMLGKAYEFDKSGSMIGKPLDTASDSLLKFAHDMMARGDKMLGAYTTREKFMEYVKRGLYENQGLAKSGDYPDLLRALHNSAMKELAGRKLRSEKLDSPYAGMEGYDPLSVARALRKPLKGAPEEPSYLRRRIFESPTDAWKEAGLLPAAMGLTDAVAKYGQRMAAETTTKIAINQGLLMKDGGGNHMIFALPNLAYDPSEPGIVADEVWEQAAKQWADYFKVAYDPSKTARENAHAIVTANVIGQSSSRMLDRFGRKSNYTTVKSKYASVSSFYGLMDPPEKGAIVNLLSGGHAAAYLKQLTQAQDLCSDYRIMAAAQETNNFFKLNALQFSLFHFKALFEDVIANSFGKGALPHFATKAFGADDFQQTQMDWIHMIRTDHGYVADLRGYMDGAVIKWCRGDSNPIESHNVAPASMQRASDWLRESGHAGLADSFTEAHKLLTEEQSNFLFEYANNATKLNLVHTILVEARAKARAAGKPFDPVAALKPMAQYINEATGGLNPNHYMWATPHVRQILNLGCFSWQWTLGSWQAAGGSMLTGGVLGTHLTPEAKKFIMFRRMPAMIALVAMLDPTIVQLGSYLSSYLAGGPKDDDKPWTWQNETGKKWYADITPLARHMPGYKGDPTGQRRTYMRWAKQLHEVFGWFDNPMQEAGGKASLLLSTAWGQVTGKSIGTEWNLGFKNEGLAGFLYGRDGFSDSRLWYTAQHFVPLAGAFSTETLTQHPETGLLGITGSVSAGVSYHTATTRAQQILATWAHKDTYLAINKNEKVKTNLHALLADVLDDAARNGYDPEKVLNASRAAVMKDQYAQLYTALNANDNKGDMDKAEEASRGLMRLNAVVEQARNSFRNRNALYGKPIDPTPEQKQMMLDCFTEPDSQMRRKAERTFDKKAHKKPNTPEKIDNLRAFMISKGIESDQAQK